MQCLRTKRDPTLTLTNTAEDRVYRRHHAAGQSLDDLVICLPVRFDRSAQRLLEQFHSFRSQLNVRYISDAMWSLSRQTPDEVFLKHYLTFVQDEAFEKLDQIQLRLLAVRLIVCLH